MPRQAALFALVYFVVSASGCGAGDPGAGARSSVVPGRESAVLETEFAAYVDAFGNADPHLSPDGSRLLFRSNRGGGGYQLYLGPADDPAGESTLLVDSLDRVRDARFHPSGRSVYFLMDRGRNEEFRLYRVDVPEGEPVALTPATGGTSVESWLISDDGARLVYLEVHLESGHSRLLVAKADGARPVEVGSAEGFAWLTDIDPDGRRVVVVEMKSPSEFISSVVDLETGAKTRVGPAPGTEASVFAYFARDDALYLVTNEGEERAVLVRVSDPGGAVESIYRPEEGEVNGAVVSRDGRALAATVDLGTHSEVVLLDPRALTKVATVNLPRGTYAHETFGPSSDVMTLTYTSVDTPTDVYRVDATTGEATALRADDRPGLESLTRVDTLRARVPSVGGLEVPVHVYRAENAGDARQPVLVHVHGGPAASSKLVWNPLFAFYLAHGITVVDPNIRGSTGFGTAYEKADNGRRRPDAFEDLAAVNGWIRAQPWAEPDRIGIFGSSYGGYLVYVALTRQPALWAAGIALIGPVNLVTFLRSTTGAVRQALATEFGNLDQDAAFLRSISPIHAIDAVRAPLFVYQGANDPRVPKSEADQVVAALRSRGAEVEYMVAEDEGHSLSLRANRVEFAARTTRFLLEHLVD